MTAGMRVARPPEFADDYPQAERAPDFSVRWKTSADIAPLKIGVLLVPPAATAESR